MINIIGPLMDFQGYRILILQLTALERFKINNYLSFN